MLLFEITLKPLHLKLCFQKDSDTWLEGINNIILKYIGQENKISTPDVNNVIGFDKIEKLLKIVVCLTNY